MVERRTPNPDVGGSNPSWPAINRFVILASYLIAYVFLNGFGQYNGMEVVVAMAASTKLKKTNAVKTEEPSPFSPAQIKKFVDEVKAEFFKIVWPDKKMTLGLNRNSCDSYGCFVTLSWVC